MTQRSSSKLRQMLALRICRYILPLVPPHDPRIPSTGSSRGGLPLVEAFVDRVGAAFLQLSSSEKSEVKEELDRNSAPDTEASVASEIVALVRVLLRNDKWTETVNTVLAKRIKLIVDIPASFRDLAHRFTKEAERAKEEGEELEKQKLYPELLANLEKIVGAISVIGASLEPQREGARVVAEVDGEVIGGIVVKIYNKVSEKDKKQTVRCYSVHLDDGDSFETSDKSKLSFISDVKVSLDHLKNPVLIMESFGAFIRHTQHPLLVEEEKGDEEEKQEKSVAVDLLERLVSQLRRQCFKSLHTLLKGSPKLVGLLIEKQLGPLLTDCALLIRPVIKEVDHSTIYNLEQRSWALQKAIDLLERQAAQAEFLFSFPGANAKPGDPEFDQAFKDTNGVVYFVGTRGYTQPFENPHDMGEIAVTLSSIQEDSAPVSAIVGRSSVRCVSQEGKDEKKDKGQWVTIDFKKRSVWPTHYTLRHYDSSDFDALRSWNFDASTDGFNWKTLIKHKNDTALNKKGQSYTWEVPKGKVEAYYQYFRVIMTGANSNNQKFLALTGFEIYGTVFANGDMVKRPARKETEEEKKKKAAEAKEKEEKGEPTAGPVQVGGSLIGSTLLTRPGTCYSLGASSYSLADWQGRSQNVYEYSDGTAVFGGEKLVDIAGWYYSALAATESGKVYSWGYNCYGQLGHGDNITIYIPKLVTALEAKRVIQVNCGYEHTLCLTDDGEVYGMGYNYYGQCGVGDAGNINQYVQKPTKVVGLDGKKVVHLSTGGYHSLCSTDKDELYTWGQNSYYQLGIGTDTSSKKTAFLHPFQTEKWAHFSLGQYHTLALTREGKVWSWGDGYSTSYPGCGHNPPQAYKEPKLIEGLSDKVVVQISACMYQSMALTKDGEVYVWGYGSSYRLGFADSVNKVTPTKLTAGGLDKERIAYVHMGPSWGQCVTEKGELYTWGYGGPQHGNRDGGSVSTPTKVAQNIPEGLHPQHIGSATSVAWYICAAQPLKCPSRPLLRPYGVGGGGASPPYPEAAFLVGKQDGYRIMTEKDLKEKETKSWKLRNFVPPTERGDVEATAILVSQGPASAPLHDPTDEEPGVVVDPSCVVTVNVPHWNKYHTLDAESSLLIFVKKSLATVTPTSVRVDPDAQQTVLEFQSGSFSYSLTSNVALNNFTLTDQNGGKTSQEFKSTLFDDRKWHSILLAYGSKKGKTNVRQLVAYFDKESVSSVDLPKYPVTLSSPNVTLRFANGMDGMIRDIGYWHFALEKKWITNVAVSGVNFVADDYASDVNYKSVVANYAFYDMEKKLPSSFELRGDGQFIPLKDDEKESPSIFSLGEGGNMKIPRGLKSLKKVDKYSVILDIYLDQLPPTKQALFKASADSSGSADLYVDSEGRLAILNKQADSANQKAGRLRPKKWHRVVLVVDVSKTGEVSCYVDGTLSIREQKHEKLSTGGRFALDSEFLLFQDDNPKFILPIKIHQMQVRAVALDPKEVAAISDPEHVPIIPDGRGLSDFTSSLQNMGYNPEYCQRALKESKLERRRASDWLLKNSTLLDEASKTKNTQVTAENLSLMGFPYKSCVDALTNTEKKPEEIKETKTESGGSVVPRPLTEEEEATLKEENLDRAINWLFENEKSIDALLKSAPKSEIMKEKFGREKVAAVRRVETKASTEKVISASNRLLENTNEPLVIGLDTMIRRPDPARVTEFPNLEKETDLQSLYRQAQQTEEALAIAYARECSLALMKNWPKDTKSDSKTDEKQGPASPLITDLGSYSFDASLGSLRRLGRLLTLVDFARIKNGLDVVRDVVMEALKKEREKVEVAAKSDTESKGSSKLGISLLNETAPVTRYLLQQALLHMINICSNPSADVSEAKSENVALKSWNASLVVWIFDIFIDVVKDGKEGLVKAKDSSYGSIVLSPQVLNLVFTGISMLSGTNCLSFVRLLSALIKMEVAFDKEAAYALKDLLNRTYSASGGQYTPFFQSLLELMVHIEKLSGGPIKFDRPLGSAATDTLPNEFTLSFTGEDKGGDTTWVLGGDWKCTADGKLSGKHAYDGSSATANGTWSTSEIKYVLEYEGSSYNYVGRIDLASNTITGTWNSGTFAYKIVVLAGSSPQKTEVKDSKVPDKDIKGDSPFIDPSADLSESDAEYETKTFTYTTASQSHGIVHYIGSYLQTTQWVNPSTSSLITVTTSKLGSALSSHALNRDPFPLGVVVDKGTPEENWVTVDFQHRQIRPTHYRLSHGSDDNKNVLRNWRLEGGAGTPVKWTTLYDHKNDASLTTRGSAHHWALPSTGYYSSFRIIATGNNSSGNSALIVSGFEIYGELKTNVLVPLTWDLRNCSPTLSLRDKVVAGAGSSDEDITAERPTVIEVPTKEKATKWVALSAQVFTKGSHYFELRYTRIGTGKTPQIAFGIAPSTFLVNEEELYDPLLGNQNSVGFVSNGCKVFDKSDKQLSYGKSWTVGDTIGCEVDMERGTVQFFVNDVPQGYAFTTLKFDSAHYRVAVSFTSPGAQVILVGEKKRPISKPPANPQFFENVLRVEQTLSMWISGQDLPLGFAEEVVAKVVADGIGSAEKSKDKESKKQRNVPEHLIDFYEVCDRFTMQADLQLVDCVDWICDKTGKTAQYLKANKFVPTKRQLMHYSELEKVTVRDLQVRLTTLQILNENMSLLLPLVDFSVKGEVSSLAGLVRAVRGLLFWSTKDKLWQSAMSSTETSPGQINININRRLAQKLKDENRCDVRAKDSYFGQLFRRINHLSPTTFRIGKSRRAWMIKFGVEAGIDAGGLYREANTLLCEELQTGLLPLFIPSPNNRESMGDNRDKWVPNPEATSPLHLSMYEFVGKLMGLAIRTRDLLNLDFPSIVWKALIGDKITDDDVIAIDVLSYKIIDEMEKLEKRDEAQRDFNTVFSDTKFLIAGSDGKEYEMVPGGRTKTLTWENRKSFCEALVKFRQHEFDKQTAAIRRGLATVVPYTLLSLFTHNEMEIQVCGRPAMNLDLLQKMTTYQGTSANDLHIRFFWDILRNRFDELERAKFLKFIWGRSRLPVRAQDFETKFKICAHAASAANPDAYMPVAHTCFFSVEMPAYTSIDVMYNRLIYAITHCTSFEMA